MPQHFLNLRPLPQGQGSLRPTLGSTRTTGFGGAQQLERLQQDAWLISDSEAGI
ncbi:hypothetical protein GARC_4113 [Paraglaciecola arctica BSs20135]|uniref:Uncharacterized protein n=1 Tax=Paraglaciecola arctica BSs20135 TaxID=493475 RepID=K6ZC97_9ALTE|nr:hypothetical protein GARC_4113 [Paraglaciecola arctica BSs20135]